MSAARYADVPFAEKQRLFGELKQDPRFSECLQGCYECGVCVGSCPSARFYDFSPRRITQTLAREDVETFYELLNDDIWNCSQCYSCTRCPRHNSPGGLVMLMREVSVRNGLGTGRAALAGYTRIIYKIMTNGTQVSPDMLQPESFPDWGPFVRRVSENLSLWRRALPPESMHSTTASWEIDERTKHELYLIWRLTGVLDIIAKVDEDLAEILEEFMDDALEDSDIAP